MKKIFAMLLSIVVIASFLMAGTAYAAGPEGKGKHGQAAPDGELGQIEDFRGNGAQDIVKVLPAQLPEELGITQLTYGNFSAKHPMFSPDGSKIAYMLTPRGHRSGNSEIHIMELVYWGNIAIVVDDYNVTNIDVQCAHLEGWSPDGTQILFRSWEPDNSGNNLWLVAADGSSAPQRLTFEDRDSACFGGPTEYQASFSPDGSKIVYTLAWRFHDEVWNWYWTSKDIYVMDSNGTGATQLTNTPDNCELSPRWSPDGSQILYKKCNLEGMYDGTSDLWVMNADGTDQQPVVVGVNAQFFGWSPDGQWIVYEYKNSTNPSGYYRDIYKVRPDGSENTLLAGNDTYCEHTPLWGPDGTILYRSDELEVSGETGLSSDWVMRANGTEKQMINPYGGMWHDWSPDGHWIAFQTCEVPETNDYGEIFIMSNPFNPAKTASIPTVPAISVPGILIMIGVIAGLMAFIILRRVRRVSQEDSI